MDFLNRCWLWRRWTVRMSLPILLLQVFLLMMWKFDSFIIVITISLYGIAVIKVNAILDNVFSEGIVRAAGQENIGRTFEINQIRAEAPSLVDVNVTHIIHRSHHQSNVQNESDSSHLPSYAEAMLISEDLPPNYADIIHTKINL